MHPSETAEILKVNSLIKKGWQIGYQTLHGPCTNRTGNCSLKHVVIDFQYVFRDYLAKDYEAYAYLFDDEDIENIDLSNFIDGKLKVMISSSKIALRLPGVLSGWLHYYS